MFIDWNEDKLPMYTCQISLSGAMHIYSEAVLAKFRRILRMKTN